MQPHEIEEQLKSTEDEATTEAQALQPFWGWAALFDFLRTLAVVFLAAFLIRHFLVQPFIVDGQSMQPTFQDQEYILVDKLSYRFREPNRGDVIVFHPPGEQQENFIKRVIGLPGEQIDIQDGKIYVNGQLISETYTLEENSIDLDLNSSISRSLGDNEYYVLGDNRNHSKDSRELGAIERNRIIGRAWVVLFPIDELNLVDHPSYPTIVKTPTSQTIVHRTLVEAL